MKLWKKEQCVALGLNKKESKIVETLYKHDTLNTSALAYKAAIPRVTTIRLLEKLHARGFVVRVEKNRSVEWTLTNPKQIEKRLLGIFANLQTPQQHIPLSEVSSLSVYYGIDAILESNKKMLKTKAGGRILAIEPNGMWKHFPHESSPSWEKLNKLFKQKNITVDLIVEEGFNAILEKEIHTGHTESFFDLVTTVRVVRSGVLDSSTEILIFQDQVLFTDYTNLTAVEIKNPSTVRVIRAMYHMMYDKGRNYEKR